jgi:phosphatidylserine/phosphatidylglycerophosphate/cardiolipin synthase-like enzyme
VGSINYSTSSMVYNRELGLITTSPAVTGPVAHAFAKWWASAPEVGPPAGTSGPTTTPPPGASGGTVSNKSPSGHYYRPGEYCPKRDLGKTITDPYGTMTCEEPPGGGQPRWTSTGPAS